jgi:serpin B
MKRSPLILATVALVVALAGQAAAQPPPKLNPDTATVVQGDTAFALDLYRELAAEKGNLCFSPYSISSALAMTYGGARGETAAQMAKTLHFTLEPGRLHPAYADLIRNLQGDGRPRSYQLQVANRLWGQKDYGFLPEFLRLTEANYGAGLKEVDFRRAAETARQTINAWVEERTKGKIKALLPVGALDELTRLVLTNAVYLKADWEKAFDLCKRETDRYFTLPSREKVAVTMMESALEVRYLKAEGFEILELPFKDNALSMLVMLPKEVDGLAAFEKTLTAANLAKWQQRLAKAREPFRPLRREEVKSGVWRTGAHVVLPKFKITAEFMLKDALSRLGMPLAFNAQKADFSGTTSEKELYISHVVHKAFVDVNEKGIEAAAATAVVERTRGLLALRFRADRPFVFLLRDNQTGSILFMGRVNDPR